MLKTLRGYTWSAPALADEDWELVSDWQRYRQAEAEEAEEQARRARLRAGR